MKFMKGELGAIYTKLFTCRIEPTDICTLTTVELLEELARRAASTNFREFTGLPLTKF